MNYRRVIPRDLFNEAKLLKCLGQLSLNIETIPDFNLSLRDDYQDFGVSCNEFGMMFADNIEATYRGEMVYLSTNYNSREPYPLTYLYNDETEYVFNDDGTLSVSFIETFGGGLSE